MRFEQRIISRINHGTIIDRKDICHVDWTTNPVALTELGDGQPRSQCYLILGKLRHKPDQWGAYIGESDNNIYTRFMSSHQKSEWYGRLDLATIIYAIIYNSKKEILEWGADFRHGLEAELTARFYELGVETFNTHRKTEKIQRVLGSDDTEAIIEITNDIFTILPVISHWGHETANGSNGNGTTKAERRPAVQLQSGKEYYSEKTWYSEEVNSDTGERRRTPHLARIEGTYDTEIGLVVKRVTNAPYKEDYAPSGKENFSSAQASLYTELMKTATPNPDGGYDWQGLVISPAITTALFLAAGTTSANTWKELK